VNVTGHDGLELVDKWRDGPNSAGAAGPRLTEPVQDHPGSRRCWKPAWIGDCIEHHHAVGGAVEPRSEAEHNRGRSWPRPRCSASARPGRAARTPQESRSPASPTPTGSTPTRRRPPPSSRTAPTGER
jgi:hypothetical protein